MSRKGGCGCCRKGGGTEHGLTLVLVLLCAAAVVVAVYLAVEVLLGVFSWHGLAFSFGLAPAGPLRFAAAVRVTTLTAITEMAAAVSLVLDAVVDGRRFLLFRWAWLAAHITLVRRLIFAAAWVVVATVLLAGDIAARRPVHVLSRRIGLAGLARELVARLAAFAAMVARAIHRREREQPPVVVASVTTLVPRRALMGEVKHGA